MKNIVVLAVVVALAGLFVMTSYNGLVTAREEVAGALANVDTQLQRRGDLIPNLINSVKGYMKHEEAAIRAVTDARSKLAGAGNIADKAAADTELGAALKNFNLVVENYPDLKANSTFNQLQDELAGSENRIATARRDYNNMVRSYNAKIRRIPGSLFAAWFGFGAEAYFEAEKGKAKVPEVKF